jgi:hypothetical protein
LEISLNRSELARYGLNVSDVLGAAKIGIGGDEATQVLEGQRRFAIFVRLSEDYRNQVEKLGNILIAAPVGGRVPLGQLATFKLSSGDAVIDREWHALVRMLQATSPGFDLDRRTLRLSQVPPALAERADGLALACALVWVLHPLNTEVVNYVVQRTESMMALCYLTTLYCALRAWANPGAWSWRIAAVAACAAGMASKESMVTAPLMVLVYDRVFLYPSLAAAFRERRSLYLGLAGTWVVLAVLMLGEPRTSVGFDAGVSPFTYFLNQLPIIGRYLWLTVWPRPLVTDYGLPQPALGALDVIVPGLVVLALGVATLLALRRHRMLAFLGVWFFVTLGPTSSVVPIATEVGAERRMYLPLMVLAVLAVVGLYTLVHRGAVRRGAPSGAPAGGPPPGFTIPLTIMCVLLAAGTMVRQGIPVIHPRPPADKITATSNWYGLS